MRDLREWIHRLLATLRPDRRDADLQEELRLHMELAADDARRQGENPRDAARLARMKVGGASQAMDALRDQRGLLWLDDLARDASHALRALRRSPGFTLITLLTLALGIGANTAIFSIVNGVILRPLGYPKPEQLMYLTTRWANDGPGDWFAAPEYLEFREINRSFSAVGAYGAGEVNLMAGDRPWRVRAAVVDAPLLGALGIQPSQGRLFTDSETEQVTPAQPVPVPGSPSAIVILSYELWQSALGGRPIVGQTVDVNGERREVIGIMPPGADLMDQRPEIWLPLGLDEADRRDRGSHSLYLIGRLKDGVTAQSAQSELDALMQNWSERVGLSPKDHVFRPLTKDAGHVIAMKGLQERILGDAGRSIWVLQVGVGLVLLIVCANLANLLLARAEARRHELAMRAALGASRGRLLRQFITEGVLLSFSGGLLGLWIAALGVEALIHAYPTSLPRTNEVTIDVPVLLFAFTVSMLTGVLFGLAPASRRRVTDLVTTLKEAGDRRTGSTSRHHVRRALVIAEVALAVMLVIGAGLLVRTVYNLASVDAGFEPSRLVTFLTTLPQPSAARKQMYQRLLDDLRAIPGVQAATAVWGLPPDRPANFNNTEYDGDTPLSGGRERPQYQIVDYDQFVMSDYFETMGIPIVDGRGFQRTDAGPDTTVVVVNETLAKRFWPGLNPIGRRLRRCCGDRMPWLTVIGMARDVKQGGVDHDVGTEYYIFAEQQRNPPQTMNLVLRTTLPPAALSQTIERVVRNVDPTVPIVRLRDMDTVFADSIRRPRLLAQLLGMFAGLALLLAAIGTYGVVSYMVTERRREIGIRMALGAGRSRVLAQVMKQGLTLTSIGVVVGVTGAVWLNWLIASLLFGVEPTDEATMVAVIATITIVATIACGLPAFRASRLDPNVVLRTN